jgi:ATPase family associated with various cellular activities (AAA)
MRKCRRSWRLFCLPVCPSAHPPVGPLIGLRCTGVFAAAAAAAPAVVFIDEVDAVAPARGGAGGDLGAASDMSGRLVAALQTSMDALAGGHCARQALLLRVG